MTDNQTLLPEYIASGRIAPEAALPAGVLLRTFVSEKCGATGFSTGTATFRPHGELLYHIHPFSEAITVLRGRATVLVEGRRYDLSIRDSIHIPARVPHCVQNSDASEEMVAHWAFGSSRPIRTFVDAVYAMDNRGFRNAAPNDPETIRRFASSDKYELSRGALFVDLFAGRFGAKGICGGYGEFAPGTSLPCHIHEYDESITIVEGSALCMVQSRSYRLSGLDTAFVPTGRPHRFFNDSDAAMSMLWVYAGDEPDRKLVDSGYCDGSLIWPAADNAKQI